MKNPNAEFYRMERFSIDLLQEVQRSVRDYSLSIGRLPKDHSKVFSERGWMPPFLLAYDALLWGRWSYWLDICQKGTLKGSGPIPQIQFVSLGEPGVSHTEINSSHSEPLHDMIISTNIQFKTYSKKRKTQRKLMRKGSHDDRDHCESSSHNRN